MLRSLLILLLLAVPAFGQAPAPPVVTLPVLPAPPSPAPSPAPKPAPGTPVTLAADVLYVASSKTDCVLIVSTTDAGKQPADVVKTTCLKGPVTIALSRFIDGKGGRETKTFGDPFIWSVEAVGPGTVELIWVPKAGPVDGAIVRQLVTTLTAPQPPPLPVDPPAPVDPLTVTLRAALAKELPTDKLLLPKLAALYRQSATLANDPANATAGELLATMHTAAKSLIGDALPNVRAAISAELKGVLPTMANAPLNAATRATAAKTFDRLATLIGGLK